MKSRVEKQSSSSAGSRRALTTRVSPVSSPECLENGDIETEEYPGRESLYRPMELGPDQILVPLKPIDYVLVYEDTNYAPRDVKTELFSKLANITPEFLDLGKFRRYFYEAMIEEGLEVREERVDQRIFIKVHCPFERLCKAAENTRLECALAGLVFESAPTKEKKGLAKKLKGLMDMEDEPYKIYAPFLDKCRAWFLGNHDPDMYYRSAVRYLLVHHILININIYDKVSHLLTTRRMIGLPFLLLKKAYLDAFVLHDLSSMETYSSIPCLDADPAPPGTTRTKGPLELREFTDDTHQEENSVNGMRVALDTRKILNRQWVGFCKSQPLDRVKDYFGEKIAFYFGWVGSLVTSLWIPTILGITVFAIGVIERMDDDIQFMQGDEKAGNKSAGYRDAIYYVEIIKASSDNVLTPFFSFVICVWGTVQSEIWTRKQITLAHRWHMDTFDEVEPDRPQFEGTRSKLNHVTGEMYYFYPTSHRMLKFVASSFSLVLMVCVVFISVTSVIVYRVYATVNWCKDDSSCSMLHGAVVPTVLNTMSIMLLGQIYQWVAIKLTDWENHRTDSNYSDSLVFKLFAFQFANTYTSLFYVAFFRKDIAGENGIMNMGKEYSDSCHSGRNDSCMSMLSFQLLSHMIIKPLPKFFKDIIVPQIKKLYMRFGPKGGRVNGSTDPSKQHYLIREMYKPPVEDFTREEMNEKIIQYGYIMMFSASLPIAPFMILIMNLCDMRVDAKRLLWLNRRPIPYQDNDIGMWMNILAFLNICGVCTNAMLLGFTSDFGRLRDSMKDRLIIVIIFESQHFVGYLMTKLSSVAPNLTKTQTVLENPTLHENTVPGDVAHDSEDLK